MKKLFIKAAIIWMIVLPLYMFAQVSTLGNAGIATNYVGWNNAQNFPLQIRHDANNQPISIFTGGTGAANLRMRINPNNAIEPNTLANIAGFVGIGPSTNLFSRLTISDVAGSANPGCYRTWMRTGVFSHQGSDAMYVGLKQFNGLGNRFDAAIAWGDDPTTNLGIDKLRFIFLSPPIGGSNTNPRSTESTNGYEYMLMTPFPTILNSTNSQIGHVGIGPVFNEDNLPQNRLHINAEDNLAVFTQISNELGTGQGANDGLRIGYPTTSANNLEAQINQRENDRLSLYSFNGERIRIMQIGALNNGVTFNPGGLANNLTRIGISHNPTTPVTRPLSLLHLGYNVANPTSNDGWREWMDVGMFISQASDNLYLGMKPESNGSDAVLAWGDNNLIDGAGPDNFRMIFTTPLGLGLGPGNAANGLEGMRMSPTFDITNPNIGIKTGIGGDPTANPYFGGSANPTATLEVNAWGGGNNTSGLRFTNLNSGATPGANPGGGVLSVNPSGDVIYVNASNAPQIGNYCGDPQNPVSNDYEIPLNGLSYNFTSETNDYSRVNIGNVSCGTFAPSRLYVQQSEPMTGSPNHSAIIGFTDGSAVPINNSTDESYGVVGQISNTKSLFHAGVYGRSFAADNDMFTSKTTGFGVWGTAEANNYNFGVHGTAIDDNADMNVAVWGQASRGNTVYGVWGLATNANTSIGVFGQAGGGAVNYAGYFDGDVFFNGFVEGSQFGWGSDSTLKRQIDTIAKPLQILSKLNPKTYFYDTDNANNLKLPAKRQYGFIAQEIEKILPELVNTVNKPADFDTTGKMVVQASSYKSVNYIGLIGIIVAAMQEQQKEISEKDSMLQALDMRLHLLERCLTNARLCETQNTTGASYKQDESETPPIYAQDVVLKNLQTIILDQNNPNPFAEKTTIGYTLPDDVTAAEIIFHNAEGKQINRTEIATRGRGEINVYAHDLSSGVYTYTLIADGKIIDTKRMVKK